MTGQHKNLGKTVTPNDILMHTLQSLIRVTPFAVVKDYEAHLMNLWNKICMLYGSSQHGFD